MSIYKVIVPICLISLFAIADSRAAGKESLEEKARRIHADAIVIDTHSDTTLRMLRPGWNFMERHDYGHMDYPRIREGGLDAVFLAIYMGKQKNEEPGIAVRKAAIQFDKIHSLVENNSNKLELALTAADVKRIAASGRLAMLIGVEGGHIIDNDLAVLRSYYRSGARYMTLTHTFHHDWADSSGWGEPLDEGIGGLSDFGRDVVREMNRLGMIVDVSHVSDDTFHNTLEFSSVPIMASHSACRAICNSPRNLTDDMLRALAARGGVVQIVFYAGYIEDGFHQKMMQARRMRKNREEEIRKNYASDPARMEEALAALRREKLVDLPPLSLLVDHIEHVIEVAGPDHVGLGGDWDGVSFTCQGVEDCSGLGKITLELLRRGHGEETVKKVLGGNLLRLMEAVEKRAQELQEQN